MVAKKDCERVSASVSASTLEAMTPLIKEVYDFAFIDYAFMSQMPTELFGTYLIPADKGVLLVALDSYRCVAVHDPEGHASRPVKVHFPDGLLDAVKAKTVSLVDENGAVFDVACEPLPGPVICNELFAMLAPKDIEKWKGTIGTWANEDYLNVIKAESWRAEPFDIKRVWAVLHKSVSGQYEAVGDILLNPSLLGSICHAAQALGVALRFQFSGNEQPVEILSSDGGKMFGFVMPMRETELKPAEHFARTALLSADKEEQPNHRAKEGE